MSIAQRIVIMVFVLPVPGGPHISFREGEWFSIAETQSTTALSCESFRVNFSRPIPSIDLRAEQCGIWEHDRLASSTFKRKWESKSLV
jgi:hypothetical protein